VFDNFFVWILINIRGYVRIKVMVLRLWKVPAFLNPMETSFVEMILIDEKKWFTWRRLR
jgi:hypothetical protein